VQVADVAAVDGLAALDVAERPDQVPVADQSRQSEAQLLERLVLLEAGQQ
jgi:hypothetical protein